MSDSESSVAAEDHRWISLSKSEDFIRIFHFSLRIFHRVSQHLIFETQRRRYSWNAISETRRCEMASGAAQCGFCETFCRRCASVLLFLGKHCCLDAASRAAVARCAVSVAPAGCPLAARCVSAPLGVRRGSAGVPCHATSQWQLSLNMAVNAMCFGIFFASV